MNFKIKFSTLLAFPLLFSVFSANAANYVMNINKVNAVIKSDDVHQITKQPYAYFDYFDLSTSGSGTYSNENRTVSLSSNTYSKHTNYILKDDTVKEARIKFISSGQNYANQGLFFNCSTNNAIMIWYNYNNSLYLYDNLGNLKSTTVIGGGLSGVYMEMRYNMDTNDYSVYSGDILLKSGIAFSSDVDCVYFVAFDGSRSTSPTTIIPN